MKMFKLGLTGEFTNGIIIGLASVPVVLLAGEIYNLSREFSKQESVAPIVMSAPKYPYHACDQGAPVEFSGEFVPQHITIQRADIDLPIVSVPLENGTWKVNDKVANFAQGTSSVSSTKGNVGIFAHDRMPGFAAIKDLIPGDIIEVYGDRFVAVYKVEQGNVTDPDSVDVFYPTEDPQITLVTCQGNFSEKRYVIRAKLNFIKELNCNAAQ